MSFQVYISVYFPLDEVFAGLEDIACTCSYADMQKKNGQIMKSEIKPKSYFSQVLSGQIVSFLFFFFFFFFKKTNMEYSLLGLELPFPKQLVNCL